MRIAILPAGEAVRDQSGELVTFSHADLDEIAQSYNPDNPAPVVVGHPETNGPAFGWWQQLQRVGDHLFAITDKIHPALAEAIDQGMFRKWSASIFRRDSTANPTPGKLSLRHVGFLGAAAPAFPRLFEHPANQFGLAFSEALEADQIYNFVLTLGDQNMLNDLKSIEGDITLDAIAEAMGVQVTALQSLLETPEEDEPSDPPPEDDPAFAEQCKMNEILLGQLAALKAERKRDKILAFCEGLVKQGKPLPKPLPDMVEFLCSLPDSKSQDFAESKGLTPLQFAMDALGNLPTQVDLSKSSVGGEMTVPDEGKAIAKSIEKARKEHGLNFAEAVDFVFSEGQ